MKQILLLNSIFLISLVALGQKSDADQQRVTVFLSNISMEAALNRLGDHYAVEFSYSDDIVPTQAIVSLNVDNATLSDALSGLLSPYHVNYKITGSRVILKKTPGRLTQTVRGNVFDELTNTPIPGATLVINSIYPQIGTITDEHGAFKLTNVHVGSITINVSFIGYNTSVVENVMLSTGKELVLEVKLSEAVTSMNEIVITSLKNENILTGSGAVTSSRSINIQDAKRFAGSMNDPARMLNATEASVTGINDSQNALVVRGNSPRGLLWKVEGIEISEPNHFSQVGSPGGTMCVFSPNMIQSIDFLTGSFPAQYGNALSAVYDLKLRAGNNAKREHSIQSGMLTTEVSTEGPFSKRHAASYLVNYRHTTSSIVQKLGYDLYEVVKGRLSITDDLSFKIQYPTRNAGTISIFGLFGKSRFYKTETPNNDPSYYRNDVKSTYGMGMIGLTYHNTINKKTYLDATLSRVKIANFVEYDKHIASYPDSIEVIEMKNYLKSYTRASLSCRRKINRNYSIEAGIISSLTDYNYMNSYDQPGEISGGNVTTYIDKTSGNAVRSIYTYDTLGTNTIVQGYVSLRQYITSNIFAYYGMHYINYAAVKDQIWEPRAGLQWQISKRKSLSLSFGKHSKLDEGRMYLDRLNYVQNKLKPTRAYHYNLAYRQLVFNRHLVKIELYYQRLFRIPTAFYQTDFRFFYSNLNEEYYMPVMDLKNDGKGSNYGIEISMEKSFSNNFFYLINGSVYESKFYTADGKQQINTSFNGNYTFHLLVGKEIKFKKHNRLGISVKITQLGGRRTEFYLENGNMGYDLQKAYINQLPDYFRADAELYYKINKKHYSLEWILDINNVTDHQNVTSCYYNISNNKYDYVRQVGRLPLLSCRVDF